jgi:23S rRNA G2445 N2-methylase RlmL
VFLYAWGTDQLTYKAEDLDRMRRWTAREVDWGRLLLLHQAVHARTKGKLTWRLVTQMTGEHGYRRRDAGQAVTAALASKLPPGWRHVEDQALVEIWLTIHGGTAVCGLRLSDRSMRHRPYKVEHRPASLRPTVAAAMVRLAECRPRHVIVDPMCGAGTILAELLLSFRDRKAPLPVVLGGDVEHGAAYAAAANLRRLGPAFLARWNATRLPLPPESIDRVLSNPPFGKQLGDPRKVPALYRRMLAEYDRVLRPGGRAVLLVGDRTPLREAAERLESWRSQRQVHLRLLGEDAWISVWQKKA